MDGWMERWTDGWMNAPQENRSKFRSQISRSKSPFFSHFSYIKRESLGVPDCYGLCKELPNKDHTTCRKERVIEIQTTGLPPLGSECSSLAGMGSGL
jgi:hypothetical protein